MFLLHDGPFFTRLKKANHSLPNCKKQLLINGLPSNFLGARKCSLFPVKEPV